MTLTLFFPGLLQWEFLMKIVSGFCRYHLLSFYCLKIFLLYLFDSKKIVKVNFSLQVYERSLEYFGEENLNETLLIAFAQFEERQKEHERSRVIYR